MLQNVIEDTFQFLNTNLWKFMTAQNKMNILKLRVNRNLPVEVTVSTVRFKCLKFLANNAPKWIGLDAINSKTNGEKRLNHSVNL